MLEAMYKRVELWGALVIRKIVFFNKCLSPTWHQKAPTKQCKNQSGSNMTSRKGFQTLQGSSEDLQGQFWSDFRPPGPHFGEILDLIFNRFFLKFLG